MLKLVFNDKHSSLRSQCLLKMILFSDFQPLCWSYVRFLALRFQHFFAVQWTLLQQKQRQNLISIRKKIKVLHSPILAPTFKWTNVVLVLDRPQLYPSCQIISKVSFIFLPKAKCLKIIFKKSYFVTLRCLNFPA